MGLQGAVGGLQRAAGRTGVAHVADEAAGGLLGADALADLAGAAVKHLDCDAVLLLESVAQLAHDLEVGAVVDDDLAVLLGLGDHLVPVGLSRRPADRADQRRQTGDEAHSRPRLHALQAHAKHRFLLHRP